MNERQVLGTGIFVGLLTGLASHLMGWSPWQSLVFAAALAVALGLMLWDRRS